MGMFDGVWEGLGEGFLNLLAPELLIIILVGAIAGTAVGVLPGLGPLAGAAIVLPLTFGLSPVAGMLMVASIYVGAMWGGSTTAVLLGMPGETASVPMMLDGYALTQKGRAGAALAIIAGGQFIAGGVAIVLVMLFSPILSRVAFAFGPAEYFALTAGGLLVMARISGGSPMSGLLPVVLGVVFGTMGLEGITGVERFTMGMRTMTLGVSIVPLAIGLFGIAQIFIGLEVGGNIRRPDSVKLGALLPTREEWRRSLAPWTRGGAVGFFFGLLPGPSATLGAFSAYRIEQSVSRNKDELGKGAIEGVAAPEAANNAAAVSGLVPALSLGLPFSATYALMLAALIVHGIQPGPMLITQHPAIFWTLIAGMYVSGLVLLIVNLPLISVWVSLLRVPMQFLYPLMVATAVIGAYSARNAMVDVYVMLLASAMGYFLHKLDFSLAPFILGIVLGPLAEKYLREGLFLSRGSLTYFVTESLATTIWVLVALTLIATAIANSRKKRKAGRAPMVGKMETTDE